MLASEAAHLDLPALDLALDERARGRFEHYLDLVLEWNKRAGLTALTEPGEIARRHFGESLALLALLRRAGLLPPGARFVDVGSGAGFPGLPLAILDESLDATLLEAHGRRARFLGLVIAELALDNARVVQARAEDAGHEPALREAFEVAVARAVAPLAVLVELTLPLLSEGGVLATPKGERAAAELIEAAPAIEALGGRAETSLALPAPPDSPAQTVLVVRRVAPLDVRYPRRPGVPARRPLGLPARSRMLRSPALSPEEVSRPDEEGFPEDR